MTGYGVDSDFRNLVSSCPVYEHAVKHLARFVDICPLSKQVRQCLLYPSHHLFFFLRTADFVTTTLKFKPCVRERTFWNYGLYPLVYQGLF